MITRSAVAILVLPLALAAEAWQQCALEGFCLDAELEGLHFLQTHAIKKHLAAATVVAPGMVHAPESALELTAVAETGTLEMPHMSMRSLRGSWLLPVAAALFCMLLVLAYTGYKAKACHASSVDVVGLLFLPVQFASLFQYSAPILDSYDTAMALGRSTSQSGLLLGIFFLGSFCGAVFMFLIMSAWPAAWRDGLSVLLRLGLACEVLGGSMYLVVTLCVDQRHISNRLWYLALCGRMLAGMGSGMILQFNYTSVPHLAKPQDRPKWMVNLLCANMLGVGFGPLATAIAKVLGPYPSGVAMGSMVNLVVCISTFFAVSLVVPTLTDVHDYQDRSTEESEGPADARVRPSHVMIIIGCLLMCLSRAFVVAGLEASSVVLLETVFHWNMPVIGVAVPATFLACIPLRLFYDRYESMLHMSNWIRALSFAGIIGSLLLFNWPRKLLQHIGLTAAWPCGAVLIFADTLMFPTLFLGNGLSLGMMQQYLLPRGSVFDANHSTLWIVLLQDGVGRYFGPWIARWCLETGSQNRYALVQLLWAAFFAFAFEICMAPHWQEKAAEDNDCRNDASDPAMLQNAAREDH